MYHRIADEPIDPWSNAVSPSHFGEQLEVLRHTRHVLPLSEFVSALVAQTLPRNAVAITFDDGYVDNLLAAKPRLDEADLPATVFLATGYLGRSGEFWWDELARLLLVEIAVRELKLTVAGEIMNFDFSTEGDTPESDRRWRAWLEPARTARQRAYLSIWRAARSLTLRAREALMAEIRAAIASATPSDVLARAMTINEVMTLTKDPLMTIGAHSVTHPDLTELDAEGRRWEIAASKAACDELAGQKARTFAYPFGEFNRDARAAAIAAGFDCACSTRPGAVNADCDLFSLPRIHVLDVNGEAFERSLFYSALAHGGHGRAG
jgi:peptidoglycan/xylan/chitin deacetylase (PgdA/CDA1 family)